MLDPVFAADIRAGAVPTDFQAVLALAENIGALSLYLFEAYASFRNACRGKEDRYVPVLGPGGLLAQIGCGVNEGDTRKARATIRHWRGLVKALWPDCPNELVRGDTLLVVRAGYAIERGRLPAPEEFGARPLEPALEQSREASRAVDGRRRILSLERVSAAPGRAALVAPCAEAM